MHLTTDISFTRYFIAFAAVMTSRNVVEYFIKPRTGKKEKYGPQDKLTLLTFLLSYLVSAAAVGVYLLTDKNTNPLSFYAGATVILVGFAGRAAAMRKISSSYRQSMTPGINAVLVTDGIYGMMRHPLYVFYALEMLGLFLVRLNWVSFFMLAVNLMNTAYRISKEEKLLSDKYGEQYKAYCRKYK